MSDAPERIWAWSWPHDVRFAGLWQDLPCDKPEYVRADLARPRVKALVWEQNPIGLVASASWGSAYIIDMRRACPNIIKGLTFSREFSTIDAAKAAAQADFESRILAALEE